MNITRMWMALLLLVAVLLAQAPQTSAQMPEELLFEPLPAQQRLAKTQAEQLAIYQARPSAAEVQVVHIKQELLAKRAVLTLPLLRGERVVLKTDRIEQVGNSGDYTWYGVGKDGLPYAILEVRGQNITGFVQTEGAMYEVRTLGGGLHALTLVDTSIMHYADEAQQASEERHRDELEHQPAQQEAAPQPLMSTTADSGSVTTVLVAYTPLVRQQAGDINAFIQSAINQTNQTYANSGVSLRLQLVFAYETQYTEGGSMSSDLIRLSATGEGSMDEIHRYRNYSGADVVILLVGKGSSCGIADQIGATATRAFAVVLDYCATSNYSFAHEIGHLQGARHNPEHDPNTTPYAYGHGYLDPAGKWRTIMAYDCPSGCNRLPYWSNPSKTYNGAPMGTSATHHNARVLNETAYSVANFRTLPVAYCAGRLATLVGTTAADDMLGTSWGDVIVGLAGNDTVRGMGGDDLVCGDDGNDTLQGNQGVDTLYGGNGDDLVYGGQGNDTIQGNLGRDRLYGDLDNDTIYGGGDDDQMWGGDGADTLSGDLGYDTTDGGAGTDACTAEVKYNCP